MQEQTPIGEKILEQLVRDYEALLADMALHVPMGAGRIKTVDRLHYRAVALGIVEDRAIEERAASEEIGKEKFIDMLRRWTAQGDEQEQRECLRILQREMPEDFPGNVVCSCVKRS